MRSMHKMQSRQKFRSWQSVPTAFIFRKLLNFLVFMIGLAQAKINNDFDFD